MTTAAPGASRSLVRGLIGVTGFMLAACSSGPPPALYVLGTAPPAFSRLVPEVGLPVISVRPVMVPDYLDTTDLVVRNGSEVIPSRTGRWGERLSVGITRTLAADLAKRLTGLQITATQPRERPSRQIYVDIEAFEAGTDNVVLLSARWSIVDGTGRHSILVEHITLAVPLVGNGDSAIVAAMTKAVSNLADRIAAGIVCEILVRLDQAQPRQGEGWETEMSR